MSVRKEMISHCIWKLISQCEFKQHWYNGSMWEQGPAQKSKLMVKERSTCETKADVLAVVSKKVKHHSENRDNKTPQ